MGVCHYLAGFDNLRKAPGDHWRGEAFDLARALGGGKSLGGRNIHMGGRERLSLSRKNLRRGGSRLRNTVASGESVVQRCRYKVTAYL